MLEGITDLYKMEEITALKAEKSSKITVDITQLVEGRFQTIFFGHSLTT